MSCLYHKVHDLTQNCHLAYKLVRSADLTRPAFCIMYTVQYFGYNIGIGLLFAIRLQRELVRDNIYMLWHYFIGFS